MKSFLIRLNVLMLVSLLIALMLSGCVNAGITAECHLEVIQQVQAKDAEILRQQIAKDEAIVADLYNRASQTIQALEAENRALAEAVIAATQGKQG